jgi:hypothetical protein
MNKKLQILSLRLVAVILLIIFFSNYSYSQCTLSSYNSGGVGSPPCGSFASISGGVGSGAYGTFNCVAGASYTVNTCGSIFDTQISGYNSATNANVFYNDDDAGTGGDVGCGNTLQSSLTWIATFSGTVKVMVNTYPCTGWVSGGSSAVLQFRQNSPTLSTPTSPVCAGNQQTITADQAGGTWSVNGGTITNGGVYTAPTTAGTYTITYTIGNCAPTKTVTVYGTVGATLSGGSTNICYNTAPSQFTATGSGGSGSYTYLWYLNGVSTGVTSQTYNAPSLTSNATVYCAVTSGSCGTVNTSTYTVSVYGNFTASLSGGSTNICYNTSPAQFTATGSGGTGSYTYLWYRNGVSTGVTTQTYTSSALTANATVYCVVTSGSCGSVTTSTYSVNVYGNLTASLSGGSTNICYNTSPAQFTATGSGGTGSYTYLWYLNGVSTGITTQTYTAPGLTANANIYCAVTSGSCGPVNTSTYSVTVYNNLAASLSGGSTNICYNTSPAQFTATGSGGTGTYTYLWYRNGVSTGVTTQTYTSPALTANANIYCAVTSGSCGTVNTSTYTVNVYGNLTATLSGGSTNICYNTSPTQFTATGSGGTGSYTYLWYLNGVSTGTTTSTYNTPALTANATVYCAVTSGSCGTVNTSTYSVTVYGNLTASLSGGSTNICYNTSPAQFTANGSGGTGSYTYLWYLNGVSTGTTTQTYIAPALTASANIYCAVSSGSCGPVNTSTYTVSVYGNLTATLSGGSANICYNTAPSQFTATGGGGTGTYTYLWYLNGVSTGVTSQNYTAPALTANANIYCAVTSGSCGTVNTSIYTVNVYNNLTATLSGGSTNICYNTSPAQFTAAGSGGTGTYTYLWYLNGVSTGTTTSTYNAPALTANATVYCAVTSGSCGTVNTSTYSVTVYSNLTATLLGGSTNICYNTAPLQFVASGSGGTGTYTYLWYLNGVSTGITTQTYTAPALTASANIYCAISSGPCGPVNTSTYAVNVYGNLTATLSGGSTNLCYNTSPAQFTATGSGGTGSYTYLWYLNGLSTGITTQTYTATPLTANATVYCAITSGSCGTVNTSTYSVTVLPQVNYGTLASGNEAACVTINPSNIIFSIAPVGSGSFTYQWYYQDGLVSCPSGTSTIGWTLIGGATSSSYDPPTGLTNSRTYAVIVTPGGSPTCGTALWANSCRQVTINPLPTVSFSGLSGPYCANAPNVTLTGSPSGGTFSGNGVSGNTFFPAIALIGNNSVTYTYTDGNGCTNSQTQTVFVNGLPSVTFSGLSGPYCISQTTPVLLTGNQSSGTFTGNGITNLGSGTANFTPSLALEGTHGITFTYTNGVGCTNSQTQTAQVVALPSVTFSGLASSYCVSNGSVQLTGFPSGGTFSGTPAVTSGGLFSPSAGVGNYTITYTYTDGNSCTNSASLSTVVNSLPLVSFSGFNVPHQYCLNASVVNLTGSPTGGTFSGPGVTGSGVFTPSTAGLGTHSITYTYTNGNNCTNTSTQTVTVVTVPAVTFGGLASLYCISQTTPVLLTGSQSGGTFSGPGITNLGSGTANFTPSVALVGTHSITYSYTDGTGCISTQTQTVQVAPLPTVTFSGLASSYCVSNSSVQLTGFPSGGTFSGTPAVTSGGLFSPTFGVGNYTITYTYTDGNSCTNSATQSTVVNALPLVSFSGFNVPHQYCLNASVVNLTGSPLGGTFSGPGVTGAGVFTPSTAGLGTHTITYTYTNGNNCTNTTTQAVTVVAVPTVSFTGLIGDYCVNDAPVTLTGNQGTNGTFSGPGITDNGNGTATFSPVQAWIGGSYAIIFSYTDVNGCSGSQTQQTVVHPQPVVAFSGLNAAYCVDANPVTLTGSHAPGGSFAGTGITDNGNGTAIFNPATAGVGGLYAITYSYADVFGCSNSTSQSTLVNDTPSVSFTGLYDVCVDQPALPLTGIPAGGVFSGTGVSGNLFYPSLSGLGVFPVTYTYSDGNGCEGMYADSLRVYDIPQITAQANDEFVCPGDNASFTIAAIGLGLTYQWMVNDGNGFVVVNNVGIYSGATTNTLSITNVPASIDGYQFNCVVTGATCLTSTTSSTVTIIENPSPVINTQPVDYASCAGDNAVFSVSASGTNLTYQWQVNTGGGFVNVNNGGVYSGATTSTLNITGFTIGMDGYQYQCIVTGTINCTASSITNAVTLNATSSPNVITQPVSQTICEGDNAVFTTSATGTGLTYQWQENTGSGFVNVVNGGAYSGATSGTLTVSGVTAGMDGYQYQCIISGSICVSSSTSDVVLITITTSPSISQQPADIYVCPTDPASFSITTQGTGITYQWQVNNGSGFVNVSNTGVYSGATASTLNISGVLINMDGYEYRCIVNGTFCSGTSTSLVGIVHINGAPLITQDPSDMNYCVGDNATFTVSATGTGLTYQWQVNNGSGWVDLVNGINYSGANSASLNIIAAPLSFDGNLYRVIVSGSINCSGSATSNEAVFNEDPNPFISSQPVDQYVCTGDNAIFSITASGNGLTYQWQENTGSGFVNVTNGGVYSGATSSTLSITGVISGMDSYTYQCIVSSPICTGTSTTSIVTLHETTSPFISVQPQDQSVCIGDNLAITVTANGSGLAYQWQVNTGSGFVNVADGGVYSGSGSAALIISGATLGMNNYLYQVIVTGTSCLSASTSNAVTLNVGQSPTILTNPVATAICDGFDASFSITTVGNNLTYQWQVNTGSGFTDISTGGVYSNATTTTLNITGADVSMNAYQYQCVVTGSINCALTSTSTSAVLTVNPSPVVSFSGLNNPYCVDAPLATLTAVPAGGTFSGPGISGNTFSAATAGVGGPYSILYEYTDVNGCYNSTTQTVSVNPLPVVSFTGFIGTYCINDNTPVALTGSPSGGVFTGSGITGNTFVPSIAQVGNNSVTYTYTNLNGCTNTQTQVVVVNSLPVVSFTGLNGPYCEDYSTAVLLTGSNPPGGTFSSNGAGLTDNGNGTASYVASVAGAGTHTITYTYTNLNGCTNSQIQSVLVNTLPSLTFSGLATQYCITNPAATLTGFPAGGAFTGAGISGNTFNPATAGLGSHIITYQYTNPSTGCTNTVTQATIVYAMPVANAGTGGNSCGLTFALAAAPSVGNGTWTVTGPGTATYSPNASSANATATVSAFGTYTFTWTEDNNGCTSSASITVNFYDQPVVSAGTGGSECDLDFTFTGSSNVGTGAWTSSGPGIAFYTNNSSATASVMVSVSGIYTFTYTVTNGTCTASDQVTVNFNVLPVSDAGQDGSECDFDFILNAAPTVGIGTWTQLSGPGTSAFAPNANDPAATVTVTVSGTYVFDWTEDHNGCTSSDDVSVVFHALPVVGITGVNAGYCVNETDVINLTGTPAGGVFSGPGVVGTVFTPSVAGVGTHTIVYDYTDNFGCSNSHSQSVQVYGLTSTAISGLGASYCTDDSAPVTLSGTPTGGTFTGAGISGNTFTASVAGTGTHTITYTADDGNGCANSITQSVVVNPLPVVSFTGLALEYCADAADVTLVSTPAGGQFSGPGITGNIFSPSGAGAGTHIIVCNYTDGNGCTNSTSQTVIIRALPVVTTTPSGTTAFCMGGSVLLAANNGFASYTWSNGNTNQAFLVNQTGQYTVDVIDNYGCTGTSAAVTVNVNALPVVDLGNDTTICTGNSVTLDAGNYVSYLWNTNGATTQTLVAASNGAYMVTVTDANGCVGSDQVSVTVGSLLQPTVTSSSNNNTFCVGGSLILDAGPGYTAYQWSDGISTSQTMTVTQAGYFSVFVTDNSGCTGVSAPVSVTTFPSPSPVLYADGPLDFCPGQSVTLSTGLTYSSYDWSPNGEAVPSITVTQAGDYSVTVQDANNCPGTSGTVHVTIYPLPTPVIQASGPLQFCDGDEVTLSVQGSYASYLWTSGSTTPQILVTEDGQYGVIVLDMNGCIDSSLVVNPVTVTVWDPQPTISVTGNTFTCSPSFSTYQWYENDTMVTVPGFDSQVLIAQSSGNYTVVVTDANGCTGESNIIEHSMVGMDDVTINANISIYPNPTNSVFTFNASFDGYENLRLELTNALGQLIIPVEDVKDVMTVKRDYNLNHLPDGMYMLTIRTDKGSVTKRIVKN